MASRRGATSRSRYLPRRMRARRQRPRSRPRSTQQCAWPRTTARGSTTCGTCTASLRARTRATRRTWSASPSSPGASRTLERASARRVPARTSPPRDPQPLAFHFCRPLRRLQPLWILPNKLLAARRPFGPADRPWQRRPVLRAALRVPLRGPSATCGPHGHGVVRGGRRALHGRACLWYTRAAGGRAVSQWARLRVCREPCGGRVGLVVTLNRQSAKSQELASTFAPFSNRPRSSLLALPQ